MGGHLASISHSSRNFLAKIREMCVKCPFWRYKRGRFGKKPRFTVKGVKVLENRLRVTSREFESHTLRHFWLKIVDFEPFSFEKRLLSEHFPPLRKIVFCSVISQRSFLGKKLRENCEMTVFLCLVLAFFRLSSDSGERVTDSLCTCHFACHIKVSIGVCGGKHKIWAHTTYTIKERKSKQLVQCKKYCIIENFSSNHLKYCPEYVIIKAQ